MARISTRQLVSMCHRMGLSLRAGTDVRKLLNSESQHGPAAYQAHMADIAQRVDRGATLAEAFRACGHYFPELTRELIDVGEQTGRLESVLQRLADHYQHMLQLRRAFLSRIAWPMIELGMGIFVVGMLILILGVVGAEASVFGLSGPRGLLIYLFLVAVAIGVVVVGVMGLLREWFGPWPLAVAMRLPVIGTSMQTMALARMAWTLSLTLDAGIDAERALRLAMKSTQYPYFTRHIPTTDAAVARGGQFHEALRQTGVFPAEFVDALETAEFSGTEGASLARLSQEYQERAESSSRVLAIAAGVLVWLAIAALLVFVIISLFISLYLGPINEAANWATNPR